MKAVSPTSIINDYVYTIWMLLLQKFAESLNALCLTDVKHMKFNRRVAAIVS